MEITINARDGLYWFLGIAMLVSGLFIAWGVLKYKTAETTRAVAGAKTTLTNAAIGFILALGALLLTNWLLGGVEEELQETNLPTIVEAVQFGNSTAETNESSTGSATRTVQVKFSAPVCVEGQGNNLKLRTDRGNMDLLIDGTDGITPTSSCATDVENQVEAIPFQVAMPPNGLGGLGKLTVTAIVKGGGVDIVSPTGAPVDDTLWIVYRCEWPSSGTAAKKGAPCY